MKSSTAPKTFSVVFAGLLALASLAVVRGAELPIPLDRSGVVSITISDAPVRSLIESIVTNGNYDFVTSGEVTETVNISLSGASIEEALDTVTRITGLEYRIDGRIITLYGRGMPTEYSKVYKLSVMPVAASVRYVQSLMEPSGTPNLAALQPGAGSLAQQVLGPQAAAVPLTPPGVIADTEHNQLIVTARPHIHRRIQKVLPSLDVPQSTEATTFRTFELKHVSAKLFRDVIRFQLPVFRDSQFMELSDQETPAAPAGSKASAGMLGGQPSVEPAAPAVEVSTSNSRRVLINDTPKNLGLIARMLETLDRPLRQIFAEVSLLKCQSVSRREQGFDVNGFVTQNGRQVPLAEFFSSLGTEFPSLALRFGVLGPEQYSILFNYFKTHQKAEIVASPKLLVQEGQEARINITEQYPVFETEVKDGVPTTKVRFTDVGTIVRFTPTVFADNTISLAINPEVSNVIRTVSFGSNGEVPVKDANVISTVLNVRSGDTAIIGGLKGKKASRTEDSNVLSRLPLLGDLFQRRLYRDDDSDLVFMLTPRVVEPGSPLVSTAGPGPCARPHHHEIVGQQSPAAAMSHCVMNAPVPAAAAKKVAAVPAPVKPVSRAVVALTVRPVPAAPAPRSTAAPSAWLAGATPVSGRLTPQLGAPAVTKAPF